MDTLASLMAPPTRGIYQAGDWTPEELAAAQEFITHRRAITQSGVMEVRVEHGKRDQFLRISRHELHYHGDRPATPLPDDHIAAVFLVR